MSKAMPADERYLRLYGHLMATERDEQGFNQMRCALCGTRNLDMIYSHSAITEEELRTGKMYRECECGETHSKSLPGMVWDADVTVICPCCSFAHCTHKQRAAKGKQG